jgi:peptide/nickel transport system substrate-binding protein
LRQAFSYAVNRQEIVDVVFNGLAQPLYQPLPPSIYGHDPSLDAGSYHYDPEKAMAMLDELGYVDVDGDGIREDPDGAAWVPPMLAPPGDYRQVAEVLEAQLRDVGIQVEISPVEWADYSGWTNGGDHDLFCTLHGGFHGATILPYHFDPKRAGASNRAWYNNEEISPLIDTMMGATDTDELLQRMSDISQFVIDDAAWVYLVVPNYIFGISKELKNWEFNPGGVFLYWNAYFEVE